MEASSIVQRHVKGGEPRWCAWRATVRPANTCASKGGDGVGVESVASTRHPMRRRTGPEQPAEVTGDGSPPVDAPRSTGTERPSGDYVQSLDRGLAVIRAFSREHPRLTLSDV